jgi:zinc protease
LLEQNNLSKAGLSNLFAMMMNEDTKGMTSEQMALALDKLGSSINVSSTNDAIVFTVQSLTKNLDKTLALLNERMFQPVFKEETFTRLKRQLTENIKNARSQASAVANVVYDKVNYGNNSILGIPGNGTEESLKNISLADIQDYYNKNISSNEGQVVVVGDITETALLPKLNFLGKLPSKNISLPVLPGNVFAGKTRIYLVDIPKAAQTEFRVGYVTNLKYDATGDYYRAYLSNYNLGGDFNGRVNLNLREDKGWTYGARSRFEGDKYTGTFTFSSGIKASATDSALSEVIRELKEYNKSGIKEEELAFLKKSIGQSDARNYETGIQKAAFVGRMLKYNLPPDFVSQQTRILNSLKREDADAIIKKYIDLDKMNIVLVGDKEKILPGLQRLGYDIVQLDADGNPVPIAE